MTPDDAYTQEGQAELEAGKQQSTPQGAHGGARAGAQQPLKAPPPLRMREKIAYLCQDGSMELYLQFMSLYLMVFYTDVCGIPPALAGMLVLVCTVWNAVNDPLVGWLVDNLHFKSGEKIRPILKYMTLPSALFVILLFWMPSLEPIVAFAYALVMYCIMDSFMTFLGIPYVALPSVLTSNANERVSLGTFASLGASLGAILASSCAVLLMRFFGGGVDAAGNVLDQQAGFRGAVIVLMAIFALCQFVMYVVGRERVRPLHSTRQRVNIFKAVGILLSERNFMMIVGYNVFWTFSLSASLSTVAYYAKYVLDMPGGEGILAPILIVMAVLVLPFVRLVNRRLHRRGLMIVAASAMLISRIPLLIASSSFVAAAIAAGLMGVAMGCTVVAINTNLNESIEIAEWKRGYRLEGMVNALRGLILKFATAILGFALGQAMAWASYIAPSSEVLAPIQSEAAQFVFVAFFSYLPLVTAVGMLIFALLNPTDRDAAAMRASKAAQAAQAAQTALAAHAAKLQESKEDA
jgi:GPH family glycoside/pentoside/hexuronide:cation symporter